MTRVRFAKLLYEHQRLLRQLKSGSNPSQEDSKELVGNLTSIINLMEATLKDGLIDAAQYQHLTFCINADIKLLKIKKLRPFRINI